MSESQKLTGLLVLILGPSGSGKGTVFKALREKVENGEADYVFPRSCTTRAPRYPAEETEGVYYFISRAEFKKWKEEGRFLEWARVHGRHYGQDGEYYGTLKEEIIPPLTKGKVVIREVDVQGLRSLRDLIPAANLFSIFLTVDSWETLKKRILRRSQMSEEELARRHQSFLKEMEWAEECDVVIESREGEIEALIADVEKAIQTAIQERLKTS